jgi:O-antigen/teichoic acid export membrane protein
MKSSHNISKLLTDTTWTSVSTIFLVLAGTVLNILVGNLFDEQGLGLYSLLTTIYIAFGTIASFGLPGAVTKFATQYKDTRPIDKQYFSAALLLGLCISLALTIIIISARSSLAQLFNMAGLSPLLKIIALGLPFVVVNKIILAQLRGYQQIRSMSIGESFRSFLIIVVTFLFVLANHSLEATVWALVFSEICLLVFLLLIHGALRSLNFGRIREHCRFLGVFGRQIIISRLFVELDARLGILIIGAMLSADDVGIFTVAFMFSQLLTILPTAFQKVTGPAITRYFLDKKTDELESFINYTMQATALILTVIAIMLIILFQPLVRLFYPSNPVFLQAYPALIIMTVGMLIRGITGSVGSVFVSIGRPDIVLKTSPIRLISNLIISMVLVQPLGINGVAAGTTVASIVIFNLWTQLMPRYLSIRINYFELLMIPATGLILIIMILFLGMHMPILLALILCVTLYLLFVYNYLPIGIVVIRLFVPDNAVTDPKQKN